MNTNIRLQYPFDLTALQRVIRWNPSYLERIHASEKRLKFRFPATPTSDGGISICLDQKQGHSWVSEIILNSKTVTEIFTLLQRLLRIIGCQKTEVWEIQGWDGNLIHLGVRVGQMGLLNQLLAQTGNQYLTELDSQGLTPLQLTFIGANLNQDYSKRIRGDILRRLLLADSSGIDRADWNGDTGMHILARLSDPDPLEILFEFGSVAAMIPNSSGKLPLHLAFEYRNIETAKVILAHMRSEDLPIAFHHAAKWREYTPYDYAARYLDLFELAIGTGIPVPTKVLFTLLETRWHPQQNPLEWMSPDTLSEIIQLSNWNQETSVSITGNFEFIFNVEALLQAGASPTQIDRDGNTILHQSILLDNTPMFLMLMRLGLNCYINTPNDWGRTPLHLAARKGPNWIKEVIKWGGNTMDVLDKFGSLPRDLVPSSSPENLRMKEILNWAWIQHHIHSSGSLLDRLLVLT